jgi:hypothetical protein
MSNGGWRSIEFWRAHEKPRKADHGPAGFGSSEMPVRPWK